MASSGADRVRRGNHARRFDRREPLYVSVLRIAAACCRYVVRRARRVALGDDAAIRTAC